MKVSRLRWSKSMKSVVVDIGVRMDISHAATKNSAYDANLDFSNKKIQAKVAKSNSGTIKFGEAMAGGLETHNFNWDISNKTTTPGKKVKGNNGDSISDNSFAGNSFVATGGQPQQPP